MVQKPLREVIWFAWQQPRLGECVRVKYPVHAPWTAAARKAYMADPRCELIIEHVEPLSSLIARLLESPVEPAEVAEQLSRSLRFCVVTKAEDAMLRAAGVGRSGFEESDMWGRYRLAGIDVGTIGPLRSPT